MSQAFHDHFSAVARHYADFRPLYPPELFSYLASLVPRDSVVWDCAAGNGQATASLAGKFARVIATDASPEQIQSARPFPRVEFRVATAEESGLPDGSVELITVAQALHWFDRPRFYSEAKRVLKPGGVLAVWAYGLNTVEGDAVNQLVRDYYFNVVGSYWPPERELVETGYRTLPFPFAELRPPVLEMEAHWTLEELLGYFGTWSATSRFIKAVGTNPLIALAERISRVWENPKQRRRVVWPISCRVGRKEATSA